tara:strand:+ start:597 stop:1115 length:519 start_codon:yes stop_codon:yes gene_type:complete
MAKKERIDLIKKVYSKTEYPKIIDTKFSELGVTSIADQISSTFTVDEFFEKYNELFYSIPEYGDINSHEYLVKTSGEYIEFDKDNSLIEALQQEIAQLRNDLLTAQAEKAELLTGEKIDLSGIASVGTSGELDSENLNQIAQERVEQSRVVDPEDTQSTPAPTPNNVASTGY